MITDPREYEELITTYDDLYIADVCKERQLPDIRDGMRIVQRRLFWTFLSLGQTTRNSFNKSATIIGDLLKLHPHGDQSCYGSSVQEVKSCAGLLKGKGNWGSKTGVVKFNAAAMRYTEFMFSSRADEYFRLADMSDMIAGEIELPEPRFIPVPLPYALISGFFGMVKKVGVSMIPSYKPKDLLARLKYLYKLGPKVIIKPWYGIDLEPEGQFEDILTKGTGEVVIPPNMSIDEKEQVITINELSPDLANAEAKIVAMTESAKYGKYIAPKDLTSKSTCIRIEYSTKYMKTIDVTFKEVCDYVKEVFTAKVKYNILVYRNYKDYPVISVDEWLKTCFETACKYRVKEVEKMISELNEKINLNNAIIKVRPIIQKYLNKYKSLAEDVYNELKEESLKALNNDVTLLNKVFASSITKLLQTEINNTEIQGAVDKLKLELQDGKPAEWCLNWIKEYGGIKA